MIKTKERRTTAWKRLWIKPDKKNKVKTKERRTKVWTKRSTKTSLHCLPESFRKRQKLERNREE